MTEKEFSRLSRKELLKLLLMQVREQNQLEEQMAEMTKQVHEWEESRGRLEQNLDAKNGQIAELERYLGEKDDQIKALKECISERDDQIKKLEGCISEKDDRSKALDNCISEKDGQIEALKGCLVEKDDQIEELAVCISEKDRQIEKLEEYLLKKDEQFKECKARLSDKDNRIRELEGTLEYERELKNIRLSESDDAIAETALKLNEIFEAAQKTADQYLENIALLAGKHDIGGEGIRNKAAVKEKSERKEIKNAGSDLSGMIRNEGKKGFEAFRRGMSDMKRNVGKDVRKKER